MSTKDCSNCTYYDPNYQGGYCDKSKCKTSSSGYCGSWK